jgi:hypothetical protein
VYRAVPGPQGRSRECGRARRVVFPPHAKSVGADGPATDGDFQTVHGIVVEVAANKALFGRARLATGFDLAQGNTQRRRLSVCPASAAPKSAGGGGRMPIGSSRLCAARSSGRQLQGQSMIVTLRR